MWKKNTGIDAKREYNKRHKSVISLDIEGLINRNVGRRRKTNFKL